MFPVNSDPSLNEFSVKGRIDEECAEFVVDAYCGLS